MGQWVDITTIDNQTPFMKVRWVGQFADWNDKWFAEEPGIVSDGMSWTDGTKDYGWFSAHRMSQGNYCCSFVFDHTMSGYWDDAGWNYQVSVKDAGRNSSGFYDSTVEIDGTTYYEVDFSLWQGASGYQLYAPYSSMPWAPGEIYVYLDDIVISGNKDEIDFSSLSGTDNTFEITALDNWTAVSSENWVSLSSYSGTSGTSSVDVSVTANQSQSGRTATVTFSCSGETFDLTINQSGIIGVTGDTSAIVFKASGGSNTQLTVTADMNWTATSSENWLTVSPSAGTIGSSAITLTADQYTGTTSARTASVTFSSSVNTFVVSVTQKKVSTFGGIILGELEAQAMYLGDVEVEALYLGDLEIAAGGPPSWKMTPSAITVRQSSASTSIKITSPTNWTLDAGGADWITLTPSAGTSGRTTVAVEIDEYTGSTSRNVTITGMTTDSASSATCVVTQNYVSGLIVPHLVNYNAKQYDPAHLIITNDANSLFQEDIELSGVPVTYDSESITFDPTTNPYAFWTWNFGTTQNNPFNCTGNESLTIIGKTDQTNGAHNHTLVGNRGGNGYNWMAREINDGMFLHTAFGSPDVQCPTIEYTSEPNIWMLTVSGQTGYGVSFTDGITGTVYTQVTMGAPSEGIGFFCDDRFGGTPNEQYVGKFYWIFIAKGSLTPQEIQEVIDYNENL